ncbi:hypothetical protein BKA70DRAFT_1268936 [Coprinopsis sp. MPI-PUGE-AT-0042]|nr:hypothetical protein BKA70DRAFT_1268936 [Coprinopsis sp. MPI-PUGE-AT-0042]
MATYFFTSREQWSFGLRLGWFRFLVVLVSRIHASFGSNTWVFETDIHDALVWKDQTRFPKVSTHLLHLTSFSRHNLPLLHGTANLIFLLAKDYRWAASLFCLL